MNPTRRNVLITGGAGYLGGLAVAALAESGDTRIVGFDVRAPQSPHPSATYEIGDIRTADLAGLFRKYDVEAVVHLAAVLNPPRGMSDETVRDIEVGGARRLLEACVATRVRHVTITSSGAAYGYQPSNRGRLLTEDDPVNGSARFAYSRHKAAVEAMLAEFRQDHPDLGQLVLRPGTILGGTTRNQITDLFEKRVILDLLQTEVPFVFIWDRDVSEIIARGVRHHITGIYNLAGDGVVTLRDIARTEGVRRLPLPPAVLSGALTVLRRLRLTQYGPEQVDFLRYRPVLANDRLKQAFPGLPSKSSSEAYEIYRRGRSGRGSRHG